MKKILIFGSSGFFGKNFLNSLNINEYDVLTISRFKSESTNFNSLTYEEISRNEKLLDGKFFDEVFDFSSNVSVDDFISRPQNMFLQNLEIPIYNINLLNKYSFSGRYNYISTDRAIHEISEDSMDKVILRNDPYGASKLISELFIKYNMSLVGGETSIIRFPNLYGPLQTSKQFIPSIISQIIETPNKEIEVGSLDGSRNFMFVSDAVSALNNYLKSKVKFDVVCFSGKNEKLIDIVECISKIYKNRSQKKLKFVTKEHKSGRNSFKMPPDKLEDSLFRKTYEWKPKIGLEEGLKILFDQELI